MIAFAPSDRLSSIRSALRSARTSLRKSKRKKLARQKKRGRPKKRPKLLQNLRRPMVKMAKLHLTRSQLRVRDLGLMMLIMRRTCLRP